MSTTVDTTKTTASSTAEEATRQVTAGFAYALDNVPDVAKPVVGKQRNPSMNKVGHKCCGGCCDVRRAVIIVNSINVAFGILGLFGIMFTKHIANNASQYENYEGYDTDTDTFTSLQNINMVWVYIINIVHLLITMGGIYGGLKYNIPLVSICGIMYVLDAIISAFSFNIGGILISLLFAYPHYFLVSEMKQNIMTPENYHNEEHSCCCV